MTEEIVPAYRLKAEEIAHQWSWEGGGIFQYKKVSTMYS